MFEAKKSDMIEFEMENSEETKSSPLFSMVTDTQMTKFRLRMENYLNHFDMKCANIEKGKM